ncbi:F-box only protein 36 isoform X1 [Xenopus tropicalis]|nr:F-box only protein 36 isoform X1 [Xenopus tropicalis]|eukprot:XP_017949320.1 PREDICTED: F-box only protein 36 isoform X3 [Xenopus tropicalis]
MRYWKISLRSEFRDARPGEVKESHQDFVDDPTLQAQIAIIFSQNTLQYVLNLCKGNYDYLERLSEPLLLYIMTFLDLEDIALLSQVSHTFQKLCNSDRLWEHIVESSCDKVTAEMRALAQDIGWKQLFYTNKLQLQLQLRRRRERDGEGDAVTLSCHYPPTSLPKKPAEHYGKLESTEIN